MHMLKEKFNFLLIIHMWHFFHLSSKNVDFLNYFTDHILDNRNNNPSVIKMSMAALFRNDLFIPIILHIRGYFSIKTSSLNYSSILGSIRNRLKIK